MIFDGIKKLNRGEKHLKITCDNAGGQNKNNTVNLCDIRDGISKFLGIYLIIQRYIQEIYTIEIISNVTFHVRGPFVVR